MVKDGIIRCYAFVIVLVDSNLHLKEVKGIPSVHSAASVLFSWEVAVKIFNIFKCY